MDVCWFWCFLQEGEGDLYERMGEVHACGHLPQMSTCIFSNPHHNPSRLVSPPTSTQWHKATSSRPTASQLWLQSKSRLSSQKGHIPFCPEFLILSKVCQWDKVIVTEKEQNKTAEKQLNEGEKGNLPEKEIRIMIVKMIQDLGKRIKAKIEKMQEMFNKDLEELKNKQTEMYNTIT